MGGFRNYSWTGSTYRSIGGVKFICITYDVFFYDNISDNSTLNSLISIIGLFEMIAGQYGFDNNSLGYSAEYSEDYAIGDDNGYEQISPKGYIKRGLIMIAPLVAFDTEDGCCDIIKIQGEDGQSAYDIWLSLGNTATKQDFIDYLASGGSIVTISWDDVTNKPTSFAPSAHTHQISDVINLQSTLDTKVTAAYVASQIPFVPEQVNLIAGTNVTITGSYPNLTVNSAGSTTIGVSSFNSRTGSVTPQAGDYSKSQVGLGNVDNTSDVNKPVSTVQQSVLDLKAPLASPTLTGTPTAPTATTGTNTTQVATTAFVQASIPFVPTQVNLIAGTNVTITGTYPNLTINSTPGTITFSSITSTPTTLSGYGITDATPASRNITINGTTQNLSVDRTWTLGKTDVGLVNVDNTSDANKPISTAQQTALNLKYDASNPLSYITSAGAPVQSVAGKTGTVTLVKGDVGLGNVDNTSDVNKPVSTATQTALNLKYDASNPSGYIASSGAPVQSVAGKTGTVILVNGDVGLGNVDNTSDVNKPVSTAQQTALNLKANLASPTLTGTPLAPTATGGTNTTQIATTAFVGSAIGALTIPPVVDIQEFTSSGTWTKPAGAKYIRGFVVGAGGGAGSGGKAATSTLICGGGGGGGAAFIPFDIKASDLTSTVTVTIAVGGAGGAALTANGTGNPGSNGGNSSFGSYFVAYGGGAGGGGTTAGSAGGGGGSLRSAGGAGTGVTGGTQGSFAGTGGSATAGSTTTTPFTSSGGGGSTSAGLSSLNGLAIQGTTGGASGGGVTAANATTAGSQIQRAVTFSNSSVALIESFGAGTGGPSSGGTISGNASAGSNGLRGGGGGGGGASGGASGGNSGAGGSGGDGYCIIVTYF